MYVRALLGGFGWFLGGSLLPKCQNISIEKTMGFFYLVLSSARQNTESDCVGKMNSTPPQDMD